MSPLTASSLRAALGIRAADITDEAVYRLN